VSLPHIQDTTLAGTLNAQTCNFKHV